MSDLASESLGTGEPHLVFLHGFTQTRASWLPIATPMAEHHRVTLIDLPGHGATQCRPPSLAEAGRVIAEANGRCVLVGYSMGARIALHAALDPHAEITGLVLIGA
ncbi:MAG: alpha/beta fold hydrolase, partial [Actinomycetota bacterium]